jgi:hypothetical protein
MDLSDVERDAAWVAEALNNHLPGSEASAAARRVLAYLRTLRGAGDGVATAVPARLGPWREWCPPRGYVLHGHPARVPLRADVRADVRADLRGGDPGE